MVTVERKAEEYKVILAASEDISITINGGSPIVFTVPAANTAEVYFKYIQNHD